MQYYTVTNPFADANNNVCWSLSQLVISLRVLVGLAIKTGDIGSGSKGWGAIMILFDLVVLLTVIGLFAWEAVCDRSREVDGERKVEKMDSML